MNLYKIIFNSYTKNIFCPTNFKLLTNSFSVLCNILNLYNACAYIFREYKMYKNNFNLMGTKTKQCNNYLFYII